MVEPNIRDILSLFEKVLETQKTTTDSIRLLITRIEKLEKESLTNRLKSLSD